MSGLWTCWCVKMTHEPLPKIIFKFFVWLYQKCLLEACSGLNPLITQVFMLVKWVGHVTLTLTHHCIHKEGIQRQMGRGESQIKQEESCKKVSLWE